MTSGEVLALWEQLTGLRVEDQWQDRFLTAPEVAALAFRSEQALWEAGRRAMDANAEAKLRLTEWLDEAMGLTREAARGVAPSSPQPRADTGPTRVASDGDRCVHDLPRMSCGYCRPGHGHAPARVVITSRGRAYHRNSSCEWLERGQTYADRQGKRLRQPHWIARVDADAQGYVPCQWCLPNGRHKDV